MITYLVIANGDSNKSYKCNTTHTSKPYIRINEHNYLDLTTETTTGVQLKYKQKTGSSYRTYNTTSQTNLSREISEQIPIYSGYKSELNSRMFSGTDGQISHSDSYINTSTSSSLKTNIQTMSSFRYDYGMNPPTTIGNYMTTKYMITDYYSTSFTTNSETYTDSYLTSAKSIEAFKNRVYIPVQSQSTTVSTTKESVFTNTTGYSGRSVYETTTYTTTGYTGASWWTENHQTITGYSASSTYRQTTGTGYRSTTSSIGSQTIKNTLYTQVMTTIARYGNTSERFRGGTTYAGNRYTTSSWKFIGGGTKSSYSSKGPGAETFDDYRTRSNESIWGFANISNIGQSTTQNGTYTQKDTDTLWTYSHSWTTVSGWNNGTSFPQQSGTTWERREGTYTYSWTATYTYSITRTLTMDTHTNWTEQTTSVDSGFRSISSQTTISTRNSYTITSRYSTTDYSNWYSDFTAYSTGTRRRTNNYTSSGYPSNYQGEVTTLYSGYTTRLSSLASSTAAGALSSTTALTSSGTRTSSSLKYSSKPGALVSITELTITSTRTSLTNRTSSTDL